jgi:hypothetical protein
VSLFLCVAKEQLLVFLNKFFPGGFAAILAEGFAFPEQLKRLCGYAAEAEPQ